MCGRDGLQCIQAWSCDPKSRLWISLRKRRLVEFFSDQRNFEFFLLRFLGSDSDPEFDFESKKFGLKTLEAKVQIRFEIRDRK